MTKHYPFLLWLSTACSLLGSFQFGFQLAVINPSLGYVQRTLHSPEPHGALLVSSVLVGAFLGALFAGSIADAIGPKRATILNTLPFAVGTALSAAATSEGTMMAGRIIAGVATGAASLLVPRYLSEIAPTPIRGLLGTLNQIFINLGIVCAFALGWPYERDVTAVVLFGQEVEWWRCMFAVGLIPAAMQAVGMLACPETPVWLLWAGLHLQASKSYRALHGCLPSTPGTDVLEPLEHDREISDRDLAPPTPPGRIPELEAPLLPDGSGAQAEESQGFGALLRPRYRLVVILAVGLPLLQQFGGINTVILYGSEVFKKAGLKSPIAANLVMGCVNMAATGVAAAMMDRAGRKALLTWSFAGMAVALGTMSAFLLLPSELRMISFIANMIRVLSVVVVIDLPFTMLGSLSSCMQPLHTWRAWHPSWESWPT